MSDTSIIINRTFALGANRLVHWFSRHWLFVFTVFIGAFAGLPWLVTLTNGAFAAPFYAGDAPGSFNSWMRLITGVLFGLSVVWFCYPRLHSAFLDTARQIEAKFRAAELEV